MTHRPLVQQFLTNLFRVDEDVDDDVDDDDDFGEDDDDPDEEEEEGDDEEPETWQVLGPDSAKGWLRLDFRN